jgi:hypothetical protein
LIELTSEYNIIPTLSMLVCSSIRKYIRMRSRIRSKILKDYINVLKYLAICVGSTNVCEFVWAFLIILITEWCFAASNYYSDMVH